MRKKRLLTFFAIVVFIFVWSAILYKIHPEKLVELIGVQNGYIAAFFIALFGEAATFSFISVYPAIITLAIGGLNPIILGVITGIGMTAGNLLYFYLGLKGRDVLAERYAHTVERLNRWVDKYPCWLVQILVFLYVGFTPLPNNLLTAGGGVINIEYRTVLMPLLLGNIALCTWVSYLAVLGIRLF